MAERIAPKSNLLGTADFLFSFCGEKRPDNGEDSFLYALHERAALVGVFDGCGGSGAGKYSRLQNKTGAYLASRAAAAAYLQWFESQQPGQESFDQEIKPLLLHYLRFCENCGGQKDNLLMGRMSKKLPTTAALALCRPIRGGVDVQLQWAGDSRVYLLDTDGLAQLTEDDLGGVDAMRNLSEDAVLTNVINLTQDFHLHTAGFTLTRPGFLFAATDGCFSYLSTPMEFEYLLLRTLQEASSASAWEAAIRDAVGEIAGDDYTISGLSLGFGSFENARRQLAGRTNLLFRTYINGLENCSKEEKLLLWDHYKDNYHRLLCRPDDGGSGDVV